MKGGLRGSPFFVCGGVPLRQPALPRISGALEKPLNSTTHCRRAGPIRLTVASGRGPPCRSRACRPPPNRTISTCFGWSLRARSSFRMPMRWRTARSRSIRSTALSDTISGRPPYSRSSPSPATSFRSASSAARRTSASSLRVRHGLSRACWGVAGRRFHRRAAAHDAPAIGLGGGPAGSVHPQSAS